MSRSFPSPQNWRAAGDVCEPGSPARRAHVVLHKLMLRSAVPHVQAAIRDRLKDTYLQSDIPHERII